MKTLFSMDGQTIDPSAVLKLKRKRIVCIGAFGATRRYRLIPHRIRTTHSLLVPVVLLSLCLCTTTTASFVSKITNKRVKTVSPLSSSSGDKKDALHPNTITRRAALAAITSIAFFPSLTQADTTNDGSADSLERIRLGEGRWKPLHRSEMIISNVNDGPVTLISASFCTYAARFLIQYDRGVSSWWTELEAHLKTEQLNKEKLLGRAFGSFAKSLEQAFGTQSIEQLYDHFVTSYGKQPDAARQIALLFTLLPASQQPIFRLQNYYDEFNEIASISNNNAVKELNYKSPSSINTSYFGDNLTRLLPATFHITKQQRGNNSGFTIEPAVTLDETRVIGEEFGGGSVITTFGPLASVPLIRETPVYAPKTYALFGLAGATGCTITHALVIPLDVLKTRAQTDPVATVAVSNGSSRSGPPAAKSMLNAGLKIVDTEGIGALFLGAQATIAGYFWYGLSVYPSYTFLKRYLVSHLDYSAVMNHANEIALLAGALAAVVASLGLTPLEAARIRVVADPTVYKPLGLTGTIGVIANEDPVLGWTNLYAGLPSLLTRQVIFGSIKFLAFERACEFLFALWPSLRDATWTSLLVSLVAGGLSGVISSAVSQPADSVLTYVAKDSSSSRGLGLLDGVRRMVEQEGPRSLFRGLGSRCVWAGSIIAGQFLLYDVFRTLFGVSSDDLSQMYEVALILLPGGGEG